MKQEPEHKCKYCGASSYVDPSDQSPPPDYCHESDHGETADCIACDWRDVRKNLVEPQGAKDED